MAVLKGNLQVVSGESSVKDTLLAICGGEDPIGEATDFLAARDLLDGDPVIVTGVDGMVGGQDVFCVADARRDEEDAEDAVVADAVVADAFTGGEPTSDVIVVRETVVVSAGPPAAKKKPLAARSSKKKPTRQAAASPKGGTRKGVRKGARTGKPDRATAAKKSPRKSAKRVTKRTATRSKKNVTSTKKR